TCEGSPNGQYVEDDSGNKVQIGVEFREMDSAKDALVAIEAEQAVAQAATKALTLDETTLKEIAAMIGVFGEPDASMRLAVVEFAKKRPSEFNGYLKSGDREYRAAIRLGIENGILKSKGEVISWGTTPIGGNEDAAVSTLMNDEELYIALQDKLGKPVEKRGPGNPAFKKKQKAKSL